MSIKNIIIFGSSGQLGKEFVKSTEFRNKFNVYHFSKKECDITDINQTKKIFQKIKPLFVINCAAYTKVDDAEHQKRYANTANHHAVENLAKQSVRYDFVLIHFSTDYVFNGNLSKPFLETDIKNPINYYGYTKHMGEEKILQYAKKFLIFRVSWVYGLYGDNFPKKIIKLAKSNKEIKVVNDQFGIPTSTKFIVNTILKILNSDVKKSDFGIYHLTPSGQTSWYKFAELIQTKINTNNSKNFEPIKIIPVSSNEFKTIANRPIFSILDNSKIKKTFKINTYSWETYFENFFDEIK